MLVIPIGWLGCLEVHHLFSCFMMIAKMITYTFINFIVILKNCLHYIVVRYYIIRKKKKNYGFVTCKPSYSDCLLASFPTFLLWLFCIFVYNACWSFVDGSIMLLKVLLHCYIIGGLSERKVFAWLLWFPSVIFFFISKCLSSKFLNNGCTIIYMFGSSQLYLYNMICCLSFASKGRFLYQRRLFFVSFLLHEINGIF